MSRTNRPTLNDLAKKIAALEEQLAARGIVVEESRMSLPGKRAQRPTAPAVPAKMAKGSTKIPTIDHTMPNHAIVDEDAHPLAARIEALLRARVMTYGEMIDELGAEERRVHDAFAAMRRTGKVFNVGDENRPRWTWVVGDRIETRALRELVERLVRERAITFPELMAATRANPNRLKHALTTLQGREHNPLRNLGTRGKAVWFLPVVKPKR